MNETSHVNLFQTWPKKWFGVWRESQVDPPGFPNREELVDTSWKPEDIEEILGYLDQSPVVITSFLPHVTCGLCGHDVGDPGQWRSDGIWLWPSRLGHYVQRHAIRLPDEMVEHIRKVGYCPPQSLEIPVDVLPWPEKSGLG